LTLVGQRKPIHSHDALCLYEYWDSPSAGPPAKRFARPTLQAGEKCGLEAKSSKAKDAQRQQVSKLKRQVEERDQVIGELMIANRVLKTFGNLPLTSEVCQMIQTELKTEKKTIPFTTEAVIDR